MKTTLNQQLTGVFDKECVPFKTKMYKDTEHQQLVHRYKIAEAVSKWHYRNGYEHRL